MVGDVEVVRAQVVELHQRGLALSGRSFVRDFEQLVGRFADGGDDDHDWLLCAGAYDAGDAFDGG